MKSFLLPLSALAALATTQQLPAGLPDCAKSCFSTTPPSAADFNPICTRGPGGGGASPCPSCGIYNYGAVTCCLESSNSSCSESQRREVQTILEKVCSDSSVDLEVSRSVTCVPISSSSAVPSATSEASAATGSSDTSGTTTVSESEETGSDDDSGASRMKSGVLGAVAAVLFVL